MRVSAFLRILSLSMLLLAFCSTAPVQASLAWSVQIVDDYGSATGNGYCPVVVDSNNTAHIAYTRWSEGAEPAWPWWFVMYASWNGSGWSTQKVSNGSAYNLVLDANSNPHILYSYYAPVHPSPTGLMYASWTGSSWISQTVDSNGAGYGVIALDWSGNPHIAYTDGTSIKYAIRQESSWSIQTVATYKPGDLAFRLAFALDKNNTPYIMYSPSSYADYSQAVGIQAINVTLATYQSSGWRVQALSLPPPTGDYGNLVVDSKGYLHSIFTQHHFVSSGNKTILSTILYASWNGTAWNTQTVVSDIRLNSMSLALDSHDYPHISYVDSSYNPERGDEYFLRYASWTGTAWNIRTLNLNRSSYGPIYLALDSSGNPYISYRQATTSQVISNIVHVTATEATQASSPTFPFSAAVAVVTVVIIGTAVTIVYFWKKKTSGFMLRR